MDLRETAGDGIDWIHLAQDREQQMAFVIAVTKLGIP
jgi:hypothetical protein